VVLLASYAIRLRARGIKVTPFAKKLFPLLRENFKIGSAITAAPFNIRYCAEHFGMDRARLSRIMPVLAEINIGREESKNGILPEDLRNFCLEIKKFPNLELCGFMTMAPRCEDQTEYYNYFKETYNLSIDIWKNTLHNIHEPIFSMGMSSSYRAAIAAGATIVRLGASVFGRTTEDVMKMKNNI
jgi:hypothetical protein